MKKITVLLFALALVTLTFAQNANYTNAMQDAITKLDAAESLEEVQAVANTFERISKVAEKEWLPSYYYSYSNMMMAWKAIQDSDYKAFDRYVEASTKALENAKTIAGVHSELCVLEAYLYQSRIMRNPMVNGARFSGTIDELLEKAKGIDPNNPRAYYIQGQQWLNMPAFMGGGTEKAIPQFEIAAEKFESFKPASDLHPNWGKGMNTRILEHIQKS